MAAADRDTLAEMLTQQICTDANGRKDLTGVYQNRSYMKAIAAFLAEPYRGKVDCVAAPESLGLILGIMVAEELNVGFLPIRSSDTYRLEDEDAVRASYIDHNNLPRTLQIRRANLQPGTRVLLADDWINTAATMQACRIIVEEQGASLTGIVSIGADVSPATESMLSTGLSRSVIVNN